MPVNRVLTELMSNSHIDIEVKSIATALPAEAVMAHRSLDLIASLVDRLRSERDAAARQSSEGVDRYNRLVGSYNDLERRMEIAQRVLRGEDIHEGCGY